MKIIASSLIELVISIVIVGSLILAFFNFEAFTRMQVVDGDKRAKVQSQLVLTLEHMSKYIQQAGGDELNPPIELYPDDVDPTGFQVRYDCNQPQTPDDLTDDIWIYYTLNSTTHELSVACSGICAKVPAEVLSTKIIGEFVNDLMPLSPVSDGFYAQIDAQGNYIDIGLAGRYNPALPVATGTNFSNPQVEIKTKVICNSSSSV